MWGGRTDRLRIPRGSRLGRGGEDRVDLSHREGHALVLAYGDDLFHVGDRGKAGGHRHPGLGGRDGGEANLDGCRRQVVVRPSAVIGKPVFNLERVGRVDGNDSPPPVVPLTVGPGHVISDAASGCEVVVDDCRGSAQTCQTCAAGASNSDTIVSVRATGSRSTASTVIGFLLVLA